MTTKIYWSTVSSPSGTMLGGTWASGATKSGVTPTAGSNSTVTPFLANTTLAPSAGSLGQNNSTAANTSAQKLFMGCLVTAPLAAGVTLGANDIAVTIAGRESNANANYRPSSFMIYVWRPSTNALVGTVINMPSAGTSISGAETDTSASGIWCYSVIPHASMTSVTASAGDIIVIEIWSLLTQAAATSYQVGITHSGQNDLGATDNVAVSPNTPGCWVLFQESFSFVLETAGSSTGRATVNGAVEATAETAGTAAGTSAAAGSIDAVLEADGSSAGTSTASANGQLMADGVGAAAGTSSAASDGQLMADGVGAAAGAATVTADGAALAILIANGNVTLVTGGAMVPLGVLPSVNLDMLVTGYDADASISAALAAMYNTMQVRGWNALFLDTLAALKGDLTATGGPALFPRAMKALFNQMLAGGKGTRLALYVTINAVKNDALVIGGTSDGVPTMDATYGQMHALGKTTLFETAWTLLKQNVTLTGHVLLDKLTTVLLKGNVTAVRREAVPTLGLPAFKGVVTATGEVSGLTVQALLAGIAGELLGGGKTLQFQSQLPAAENDMQLTPHIFLARTSNLLDKGDLSLDGYPAVAIRPLPAHNGLMDLTPHLLKAVIEAGGAGQLMLTGEQLLAQLRKIAIWSSLKLTPHGIIGIVDLPSETNTATFTGHGSAYELAVRALNGLVTAVRRTLRFVPSLPSVAGELSADDGTALMRTALRAPAGEVLIGGQQALDVIQAMVQSGTVALAGGHAAPTWPLIALEGALRVDGEPVLCRLTLTQPLGRVRLDAEPTFLLHLVKRPLGTILLPNVSIPAPVAVTVQLDAPLAVAAQMTE